MLALEIPPDTEEAFSRIILNLILRGVGGEGAVKTTFLQTWVTKWALASPQFRAMIWSESRSLLDNCFERF